MNNIFIKKPLELFQVKADTWWWLAGWGNKRVTCVYWCLKMCCCLQADWLTYWLSAMLCIYVARSLRCCGALMAGIWLSPRGSALAPLGLTMMAMIIIEWELFALQGVETVTNYSRCTDEWARLRVHPSHSGREREWARAVSPSHLGAALLSLQISTMRNRNQSISHSPRWSARRPTKRADDGLVFRVAIGEAVFFFRN